MHNDIRTSDYEHESVLNIHLSFYDPNDTNSVSFYVIRIASIKKYHIVTVAIPKLDPSRPRATSVNCCAASRIRLRERDLGIKSKQYDHPRSLHTYPSTAFTNRSFTSGVALLGTKSS